MVSEFLNSYRYAVSLDDKKFDCRFPPRKGRADFLLYGQKIVCELKEFLEIDIPAHVERVWKKDKIDKKFIGSAVGQSIRDELQNKAGQIRDTKQALSLFRALGLVILENRRPEDLSSVLLIGLADWELQRGLGAVDGVLCVDFVNTFKADNDVIHFAQLVARPSRRGRRLSKFVHCRLMPDMMQHYGIPYRTGYDLASADQSWQVNSDGKFKGYSAKIDFRATAKPWPKLTRKILYCVGRWAWLIGLVFAVIYWALRRSR